ncbi:MAG: hypothetical protein QW057_02165 [Candidatus Bathyarchaeia archaeon]
MTHRRPHTARRGQFIIIAAVLIGVLVMTTALAIGQLATVAKRLNYKPVKETILAITSDLDRALTHALSAASLAYNASGYDEQSASEEGYRFISAWTRSVLTAYSNLGLEMKLTPAQDGYTDVKFLFDWGTTTGLSYAATKFHMNATALGFTGWKGESVKAVILQMKPDTITVQETPLPGTTTVSFQLTDENGAPISDVAEENLQAFIHLTQGYWVRAQGLRLSYLGAGIYTLTMSPRLNRQSPGIILAAQTPDDRVLVQAYYLENEGATQTFQSQGLSEEGAPDEDETNNGSIQVGDLTFDALSETTTLTEGTYSLTFTPPPGYVFVNWTATGNITVENPYSPETTVTVTGGGNLTAFYQAAVPHLLAGWSEQVGGGNPKPGLLSLSDTQGQSLASGQTITYQYDDPGLYVVTYTPNSATLFLNWRSEGNVTVESPFTQSTNVTVGEGGGNVIAVYQPLSSLSLSSLEEDGRTFNLGNVTLENQNGQTILRGPAPQTLYNVTSGDKFTTVYAPENGYVFLYWQTLGNVTFRSGSDSWSNPAKVTVGQGVNALIAIYRQVADVQLNSEDWEGLSVNQGWTTFNGTDYTLPTSLDDIAARRYDVAFTPRLSNQTFLWWNVTGAARVGNSTSASTWVEVNGDCNLTAVYVTGIIEPPRPPGGPWDILYVDSGYMINPVFLWTQDPGKLAPSFSMGNEKLAAVLYSPLTPRLSIAELVNVSVIVRPNPPNSVKEVYVELGYIYNGTYHLIGNESKPVSEVWGIYTLRIDPLQGDYVNNEPLIVPEGSVLQLLVVLTFYKEYTGWGTFFLYYGYLRPSQVELGGVVLP